MDYLIKAEDGRSVIVEWNEKTQNKRSDEIAENKYQKLLKNSGKE